MNHFGWWPDYVTPLFHRDYAKLSDEIVHERVIVKGLTSTLKVHFLHESIENLEDLPTKMNQYSTAGALISHERNKMAFLRKAIEHGLWTFFRSYLLRVGFLDSREGCPGSVDGRKYSIILN